MEKIPFIINELSIHKMPGLEKGLKKYEDLSPHINIIAGPNASGKSSTARMIRQIIRRDDTTRLQADSVIHIGREPWFINIDSRHVTIQRNGIDDQLTGLPPAETQNRYMLAFHELVNQEEKDLARAIVRESIGGYDLDRARRELNYSDSIFSKRTGTYGDYDDALKAYEKVYDNQKELKDDEERLEELSMQEQQAREASRLRELYQKVKEWLAEKQHYQQAKEKLEDYPDVMGKLTGEEYQNIESLEKQMAEAKQKATKAGEQIEECRETLSMLSLPEEGIRQETLDELEKKIARLEDTGRKIEVKEQEISKAQKERDQALKNIGRSLDPEQWKGINLEDTAGLQEFLNQATRVYTEKQFLETELQMLEQEPEKQEKGDPDTLRQGIQNLSLWLQEQTRSGIARKWIGWMAAAGALTATATWLFGPVGLTGIAIIIILAVLALQKPNSGITNTRQDDFRRSGLEEPSEWTVEQVTETMNHLTERLKDLRYRDKINKKTEKRKEDLEKLKPRLELVQQTHQAWMEKLKAAPDLPSKDVENYHGLYYFLDHVKEWQGKHAHLEALMAQKVQLEKNQEHILREINERFSQHHASQAKDADQAGGMLRNLRNEEQTRKEKTKEISNLKKAIREFEGREKNNKQALQDIYHKLGLEEDQKDQVKALVKQLDDYKQVEKQYYDQASRLKVKREQMESHSLYEANKQKIETLAPDQVEEHIDQHTHQASGLEDIRDEIARINERIDSTRKGNELENALREKEQALDKLDEAYQQNLSSLTGHILVEELKKESHEQNQTPVAKRANELFNRITRGRYKIQIEEKDIPSLLIIVFLRFSPTKLIFCFEIIQVV